MNRFGALLTVLAVLPVATAQGELGTFLATTLSVSVAEEATNDWGTVFVLLDDQSPPPVIEIENQLKRFMVGQADSSAAVVYLHPQGPDVGGRHFATTIRKTPSGHVSVASAEWGEVLRNAERAFWFDFADIVFVTHQLAYTFGSTRFLSETPETLLRNPYDPPREAPRSRPPPINGCVSDVSQHGSSMTCCTGGRPTYRSTCTVDARGNISCRSDTY